MYFSNRIWGFYPHFKKLITNHNNHYLSQKHRRCFPSPNSHKSRPWSVSQIQNKKQLQSLGADRSHFFSSLKAKEADLRPSFQQRATKDEPEC